MKAYVDPDKCISCTLCTQVCPDVYKMDSATDKAVAYVDPVPADKEDCAKEGAEQCPTEAIAIE